MPGAWHRVTIVISGDPHIPENEDGTRRLRTYVNGELCADVRHEERGLDRGASFKATEMTPV